MYTLCWSPKGGSGTTVIAAAIALLSARSEPTVLIDLGGDTAAALGIAAPDGPGMAEWLASPHATPEALWRVGIDAGPQLRLIHSGSAPVVLSGLQAERLAAAAASGVGHTVIDAGPQAGPPSLHRCAARSLVVVRPCYLALRRAVMLPRMATGAVVVTEPGRALRSVDVERALGVPVVADVAWDPAVARAIDAGLLASRLPATLSRTLARTSVAEPAP